MSGGPPDPIFNFRRSSVNLVYATDTSKSDEDSFGVLDLSEHDVGVVSKPTLTSNKPPRSKSDIFCQEITDHLSKVAFLKSSTTIKKKKTRNSIKLDPPARERPINGTWPKRDKLSFTRSLTFLGTGSITEEHEKACKFIMEARSLREKYQWSGGTTVRDDFDDIVENNEPLKFKFSNDGIAEIFLQSDVDFSETLISVPSIDEFVEDYSRLVHICNDGAMRSYCFQRLQLLSSAFKMHVTANGTVENEAQSNLLGTDFYRTMKIDNHIHLAAAASAKQFVHFVGEKLRTEGDTIVLENGQTLKEVFATAGLSADHLTIDAFNVLADYSVYQRFDNFNSKYSPFRMAQLRKIFLKIENILEGR
jgi:hypothetical protein